MSKHPLSSSVSMAKMCACWGVHLFTAFGAIVALLAIHHIMQGHFITAFWWMALAVVIDASDGTLARALKVKSVLPQFDGAMLDNIVDYINYVFVPAIFVLYANLVPTGLEWPLSALLLLSSGYQFCQQDAKTKDNFFKGFPSYWNITIFYMFILNTSHSLNFLVFCLLAALIFVPIKYVYPSRMENISESIRTRKLMLLATLAWAISSLGLLWTYPQRPLSLLLISLGYIVLYVGVSLYRTWWPLIKKHTKRDRG